MQRANSAQWTCRMLLSAIVLLMCSFDALAARAADAKLDLRIHVQRNRVFAATTTERRKQKEDEEVNFCRIHLLDAARKPVRPPDVPFWKDHFVSDGTTEVTLEPGKYTLEIEAGPEYARIERSIEVLSGKNEIRGELRPIANLAAEGWYSADLHVHRPVEDMAKIMQAENLDVAPVITWWNQKNLWADKELPMETNITIDRTHFCNVMAGEDEREGGALLFFGLKKPLPIQDATREYPSPMKFIEMAREQQPDVWIDIEKPFWWDVPVWLALGNVNSIGIANNHMCRDSMYETEAWGKPRDAKRLPAPRGNGFWSQEIYYHILNTGLRVSPSAGSASGVLPNPVGYNRIYVYTATDTPINDEILWWDGMRHGRTFVTNGPLLRVFADGHPPGHVFEVPEGKTIPISFEVKLTSQDHVEKIEIVQNGKVVKKIPAIAAAQANSLGTFEVKESGWFLVRAIAENRRTFRFASTAPFYVEVGDKKQRISRQSAQFFLDWVNERAERVKTKLTDPEQLREVMVYHDRAREFWQKRVADANVE